MRCSPLLTAPPQPVLPIKDMKFAGRDRLESNGFIQHEGQMRVAPGSMSDAEEEKLQLQKLIRHFFFEIQKKAPGPGDANAAAAKAVERAKEWLAANGWKAPLPC